MYYSVSFLELLFQFQFTCELFTLNSVNFYSQLFYLETHILTYKLIHFEFVTKFVLVKDCSWFHSGLEFNKI